MVLMALRQARRAFITARILRNKPSAAKDPQSMPAKMPEIPPAPIHRVTYEYPPPPEPDRTPPQSSAWRRHIPLLAGVGGLLWAVYAINYVMSARNSEQTVLNPTKFSTFRITCREPVSDDLILLELAPKYAASIELVRSGGQLWNGKKLWSVQIKHPDLQIARKYTPLPLYFMQYRKEGDSNAQETERLLRMIGDSGEEGRLVLLVKRYADGEMSRYLHSLPAGSDIQLRGPFIEHKFPYSQADMLPPRHPMLDVPTRIPPDQEHPATENRDAIHLTSPNIAFFAAGTGIAPALQMLLSPSNPPRGFVDVWWSVRHRRDVPFEQFLLFLERAGRAKFHIFVDEEQRFVGPTAIPTPTPLQAAPSRPRSESGLTKYSSAVQQFADKNRPWPYAPGVQEAVVCGPPGYLRYMTGDPGPEDTNPIAGVLGSRGWTRENTHRMNDL